MRQKICDLEEFTESDCVEFSVKSASGDRDAFIIIFDQHYYAYENHCPHTGVNLNWLAQQFFSLDGNLLQCSMHGALFEPMSGKCLAGPCQGQNLHSLEIIVENESIYLK